MKVVYIISIIVCLATAGIVSAQNYSLSFDGDGDYIEIPDADILSPSNFTLELWVNQPALFPNNIGGGYESTGRNTYIFKANGTNIHTEYNFMENPNAPSSYGAGLFSWIDFGLFESDDEHPEPNVWTHIAVTFDSDLNIAEIFVNGVSVGRTNIQHEIQNTPGNLYFGYHPGDPIYNSMTGTLDEIRISDNIRYTSNFTPPTNEFTSDANTVALYHFNEGSGTSVTDASGNGNNGTIYGATWSTDVPLSVSPPSLPTPSLLSPPNNSIGISSNPTLEWSKIDNANYQLQVSTNGNFNTLEIDQDGLTDTTYSAQLSDLTNYFWRVRAISNTETSQWSVTNNFTTSGKTSLSFDGVDDYVSVPDLGGLSAFTFEMWVKLEGKVGQYRGLFGTQDWGVGRVHWEIIENNTWECGIDDGDGVPFGVTGNYLFDETAQDTWMHLAASYQSGGTAKLFVNGVFDAEQSTTQIVNLTGLRIGDVFTQARYFRGLIDEVRISNIDRYSTNFTPSLELDADANTLVLYHFNEGSGSTVTDASGNGNNGTIYGATWSTDVPPVSPPSPPAPSTITIAIDIKPQFCPNPLNTKSKGVLQVAILGSDELDVSSINPQSVSLAGVSPIRWGIEDVSTPIMERQDECDCTTDGADGFDDLTLKFKTQEIVAAIGSVNNGKEVVLTITAELFDGTLLEGEDCIIVKSKGKKNSKTISPNFESLSVLQNYPNPFNPSTQIEYSIPKSSVVVLKIYNINGQEIRTLVDEFQSPNTYFVSWDGRNDNSESVPSGVYFANIVADSFNKTVRLALVK